MLGNQGTFSTGTSITAEDLLKLKRELNAQYKGSVPFSMFGMPIFESNYMPTETEEYEVEIELTFKQRWIEPLKHPVVLHFEPWVRTKTEKRYRQIPSNKALMFNNQIFCSPVLRTKLKEFTNLVI